MTIDDMVEDGRKRDMFPDGGRGGGLVILSFLRGFRFKLPFFFLQAIR